MLRLQKIDAKNLPDHVRLTESDNCLFMREYTARMGYKFGETNGLISNLKKKPGARGIQHKARAITQCATELARALNPAWLIGATLVPVPPSKIVSDPLYDDRMQRVCQRIGTVANIPVDVRILVRQRFSMHAAHESQQRPSVGDLVEAYEIDESLSAPAPTAIGVIDDVLTAGTHFRAMEEVLAERFPNVPITGIFWARRVFPPAESEFDDISGLL